MPSGGFLSEGARVGAQVWRSHFLQVAASACRVAIFQQILQLFDIGIGHAVLWIILGHGIEKHDGALFQLRLAQCAPGF